MQVYLYITIRLSAAWKGQRGSKTTSCYTSNWLMEIHRSLHQREHCVRLRDSTHHYSQDECCLFFHSYKKSLTSVHTWSLSASSIPLHVVDVCGEEHAFCLSVCLLLFQPGLWLGNLSGGTGLFILPLYSIDKSRFSSPVGFVLENECEGKPEFSVRWEIMKSKKTSCLFSSLTAEWYRSGLTPGSGSDMVYAALTWVILACSKLRPKCCEVILVSYGCWCVSQVILSESFTLLINGRVRFPLACVIIYTKPSNKSVLSQNAQQAFSGNPPGFTI